MSNRRLIKSEAAHLINEIESLEAFCKVARERALELYTKIPYGTELLQKDKCVSAHELIRLATGCQLSAAKIDLMIDLEVNYNH